MLRLRPGDLDRVHEENRRNTQAALDGVLLLWLHKMYNVEKYGPPTWEMLVEAISKDSSGNNLSTTWVNKDNQTMHSYC